MPDMDDVFAIVREGGDKGSAVFIKMARELYLKAGEAGLQQWVHEAFRQLPPVDQEALAYAGMLAVVKESIGQTVPRTSH